MLETVIIEPPQSATATVIWLHGLGADGNDFVSALPALNLPADHSVRFIFPHAPVRPVTLNWGMPMRAWFDINSLENFDDMDHEGIQGAVDSINELITQETTGGIPPNRIILAGFSQGGSVALLTALCHAKPLAGLIALSTFLPSEHVCDLLNDSAHRQLPIWQAHGLQDNVIHIEWGKLTYEQLKQSGFQVDWHTYPMGHEVCAEELAAIGQFIRKYF